MKLTAKRGGGCGGSSNPVHAPPTSFPSVDNTSMSTEPTPEAASEPPTNLKLPQQALAERIQSQWSWVHGLYLNYSTGTHLRDASSASRASIVSAIESVQDARLWANTAATSFTEPTPAMTSAKEAALDFRRKYKGFIVGVFAFGSALAAIRAGPGRLEQARVAIRNLVVFGGGATAIFYPELVVQSLGPAIGRSIGRVETKMIERK